MVDLTIDEIELIILRTEPDVPASVDGSKIWTRRMAVALHEALASRAATAEVAAFDVERFLQDDSNLPA